MSNKYVSKLSNLKRKMWKAKRLKSILSRLAFTDTDQLETNTN